MGAMSESDESQLPDLKTVWVLPEWAYACLMRTMKKGVEEDARWQVRESFQKDCAQAKELIAKAVMLLPEAVSVESRQSFLRSVSEWADDLWKWMEEGIRCTYAEMLPQEYLKREHP